jgi:hypothetical protein
MNLISSLFLTRPKRSSKSLNYIEVTYLCCFITVDFVHHKTDSVLTYKLSLHKNTNIIKKITKTSDFLILSTFIIEQS